MKKFELSKEEKAFMVTELARRAVLLNAEGNHSVTADYKGNMVTVCYYIGGYQMGAMPTKLIMVSLGGYTDPKIAYEEAIAEFKRLEA